MCVCALGLGSPACCPARPQDVVTLYIGDDQTDEDAFRVLKDTEQGACVYVCVCA